MTLINQGFTCHNFLYDTLRHALCRLNEWWTTHGAGLTDKAPARIYVNGDSTLPSRRAPGELWTALRTEAVFARLIFDTAGLPQ